MTTALTRSRMAAAALVAAVALAAAPAAAHADSSAPLSDEQAYELTCGHLGVPCAPAHRHAHRRARVARAHGRSAHRGRPVTRARTADR